MAQQSSKLIFSRSGYQKGLLGFCDICYNIVNTDKTLYYKCEDCEDFLVCQNCMQNKRHTSHPAHHSFVIGTGPQDHSWVHMNLGIICDLCSQQNFPGRRYQCQSCLPSVSFDVCSLCLPRVNSFHPNHKFVFVPNPTKIHVNRILLARRAINLLKNSGSNGTDRDDATGWRMSDAQAVLATDTAKLQQLIDAVTTNNLSNPLSELSDLTYSSDTESQSDLQALVEEVLEAQLNNLQRRLLSSSINEPAEDRLETSRLTDHSASFDFALWLKNFTEEQTRRNEEAAEERKREEAEEDRRREERIRQKVIHDKIIREKLIRQNRERKFYADKAFEEKRIREQYQTANRLAQERRTQQSIENQRVAQENRMAAIRAQQIRDNAIQQQILEDARRQQQIREEAIRQQRR